jgi:hypothetical protein
MSTRVISREDARQRGLKHYFTAEACPRGHVAPRFVSTTGCTECTREDNKRRYLEQKIRRQQRDPVTLHVSDIK